MCRQYTRHGGLGGGDIRNAPLRFCVTDWPEPIKRAGCDAGVGLLLSSGMHIYSMKIDERWER